MDGASILYFDSCLKILVNDCLLIVKAILDVIIKIRRNPKLYLLVTHFSRTYSDGLDIC